MNQGAPFLPYGRQAVDEDDIDAVIAALRSDLLAHGPRVALFETAFAEATGAAHAVACSSGTAALHLALAGLDVGPGDLCIVPAVTFLATATAVRLCGADVVFADVDGETGALTADRLSAALAAAPGPVKAVLPVHLGGRLCDLPALVEISCAAGALIIEDACHALGGTDRAGAPVGHVGLTDAAAFSLHPVKTIAAGEGGMVTAPDGARAERMRRLRNHGVSRDPGLMSDRDLSFDGEGVANPWSYEQLELGFNYRMDEMSAALGLSQLRKLPGFAARRRGLAARYDAALAPLAPLVRPIGLGEGTPSPHLYQVLIDFERVGAPRAAVMRALAGRGVGSQVHYAPLYRQPYFRAQYPGLSLPGAEAFYNRVLALPLFPAMLDEDVDRVVRALGAVIGASALVHTG